MTDSPLLLDCAAVTRTLGGRVILDDVALRLGRGAFALTGANGTGKSTLLAALAGIEPVDGGTIRVAGFDLAAESVPARRALAFVPDTPAAYDFMSGAEFLALVCALRGVRIDSADEALHHRLGLAVHLGTQVGAMSLGTRKKLMIAAGLLGRAAVILMDEPTNGIDADAKSELAREINERKRDALVLFSTHDQAFIEATGARTLPIDTLGRRSQAAAA